MHKAGVLLRQRNEDLARLMAIEMGKPLAQGRAEAEKCAWVCDYYGEHAANFLADEPISTDAGRSYVSYRPLGVVLAVMPWNFPLWQVFRFAAPGLMAGNAGVLKHASNVSGCALAIEDIFHGAGFPPALFRTLLVGSNRVAGLIEAPEIRGVTLTGSTPAGRAVAAKAGACLKKTVLELGGSDPYLILEDADLELAVETCVAARLMNGGQSCIAAKRFIVVEPVRKRFEQMFVEKMKLKRMGDPLEAGIDLGPQARCDLRDQLHQQVTASVARGARLLLGGRVPEGPGAFYPPTVLTGVAKGQPAYAEELFGPVAAVIGVQDEAEAMRVANDSAFGLGAAVFTQDVARGERIANHGLEAGSCFVNGFVKSDPRLPFGGVKDSGYGRELSIFGIREFVNVKTIWVR
jgi:succinate-semialdehyde dehydrogenase/glutarate-semialdehyde dehydrogenase